MPKNHDQPHPAYSLLMGKVPEVVSLDDMRRHWWITYKWENVQAVGEEQPRYLCTGFRPIEEAESAAKEFDLLWAARYAADDNAAEE